MEELIRVSNDTVCIGVTLGDKGCIYIKENLLETIN